MVDGVVDTKKQLYAHNRIGHKVLNFASLYADGKDNFHINILFLFMDNLQWLDILVQAIHNYHVKYVD